jgi:DnaJ like chaperone protein
MQPWGAILGLLLGYFLRGFWGALLGFFLGQKFAQGLEAQQHFSSQSSVGTARFLQALFSTLGQLNKAKGRITEQDIQFAEQLMHRLQLNPEAQALAQQAFRQGKEPRFPLRQRLQAFRVTAADRPDWLQLFLRIQLQAATASGVERPEVQRVLGSIAEELPLSSRQLQQLLSLSTNGAPERSAGFGHYRFRWQEAQQHTRSDDNAYYQAPARSQTMSLTQAYQVLGIEANEDPQRIKRAYRKLMFQHHPDKLAAQGLSAARMEQAKQQAQTIQAAYDLIKRQRNFK